MEKLKSPKLLKKFPAFYGTRRFITCPYPEQDQSSLCPPPNLSKVHFSIILHLCLGLPSGLLPSGFPTKALYAPLLSPIRDTCPASLSLLDLITRMMRICHIVGKGALVQILTTFPLPTDWQ
jgi:hypothetical protein